MRRLRRAAPGFAPAVHINFAPEPTPRPANLLQPQRLTRKPNWLSVAAHESRARWRDEKKASVATIFISYRRSDAGGHAGRLFDRLRHWFDVGEVFFDVDGIDAGQAFPQRLDDAVLDARVVVAVIGPDWLASLEARAQGGAVDYVRRELALALSLRARYGARFSKLLTRTYIRSLAVVASISDGGVRGTDLVALHHMDAHVLGW